ISTLILIAVSALFYRNYWMQDEIVEYQFQTLSTHSGGLSELVRKYQDEMYFRSEDGSLDEVFLEKFNQVQLMYENFNFLLEKIEEKDWDQMPGMEMAFLESVQQYVDLQGEYDGFTNEELAQRIEYNSILLEHSLSYEDDRYSISTTNFMKSVFEHLLGVQGLVIFIFLFGVSLVMEKENQTIRTLVTQPISKGRLIFGKFLGQMGTVIFSIILIVIVSYVIPLFFGGYKGSFLYPHVITYEDSFTHISLGNYLLLYITIFLGVSALLLSINLLFSILLDNRFTVLFLSFLTIFGVVYVTNQFSTLQSAGNPFYYVDINSFIEKQQLSNLLFITVPYIYTFFLLLLCILFQYYK